MSMSTSTAAERAITGADDPLLLHHHGLLYHVPQHSRREKLRFHPDNSPSLPSLSYSLTPYAGDSGGAMGGGLVQIQPPQAFSLTLSPTVSPLPLGPFTGYAAVLNRSRFLDPARQLLEEIHDFGRAGAFAVASCGDPPELMSVDHEVGAQERQWKKASLISMIDEVCRRYKIYCQQVQTVITSFEMVAGLSTAAPYVSLAIKSMAKHFVCLKNVMSNKLERINKTPAKEIFTRMEPSNFGTSLQQRENNSDAYRQPHIWRPQRGLPENAVAMLRSWLFEHFLHPYPTDVDKQLLAKQTGLTRNQVSNWFINARVRLWKPMVEDIHNLELRQLQKTVTADENQIADEQPSQPSLSAATSSSNRPRQNCSNIPRSQTFSSGSYLNNDLPYIAQHIEEPYSYLYNNLSNHGDAVGADVGQGLGVSLTLGLRQNNGVLFPAESIPAGVVRRFGLEDCGEAYVVGKSNGGHLLHDFVG